MNPQGLQFKKFKNDFTSRMVKPKLNEGLIRQVTPKANKNKENIIAKSPQKQPTSFRELSGSRDKNKLFSGKKAALENKLNTLRNNQLHSNNDKITSEKKISVDINCQESSGKKEGIFKKLFTSRSPTSGVKILNFDESKDSINGANDSSSGMTFSAFKGITLTEENLDCSNLTLNKAVSAEEKSELKGLKFKGFPHKKTHMNNQDTKLKTQASILFAQGPLICQKGRSSSKNKKNVKGLQQTKNAPKITNTKQNKHNQPYKIVQRQQKPTKIVNQVYTAHKFEVNLQNSRQTIQSDEVIRSREGSLVFDMSPYLC